MTTVMKKMCFACPYNYGDEATEQAYNYGCLPSVGEINEMIGDNKSWACHSAPTCVCKGYADDNDYSDKPLLVNGYHNVK